MNFKRTFQIASNVLRLNSSWRQLQNKSIFTQSSPLYFKLTNELCAEPMKRKKKVDPGLMFQKEVKKQRKLEKEIRKLENKGRIMKPIEEYEVSRNVANTLHKRHRKAVELSDDEVGRRASLTRTWTIYKQQQYSGQDKEMKKGIQEMSIALQELKEHYPTLYHSAITADDQLIPFTTKGPSLHPPIKQHIPPDGDFNDITRKFDK